MAFGDMNAAGCSPCPMMDSGEAYSQDSDGATELASDDSRCAVVDDLNYDGRTAKVKAKDAPGDVPSGILYIADVRSIARRSSDSSTVRRNLYSPGIPPTFIVFYGVYLI